ncbi:MAG TPA: anaerobic glycerol-3-phosphate dehydrogenase subunit B [Anaeromyxobacter sp.]
MTGPRLDADVLVIGGGMAGAMAALAARQAGAQTVLVRRSPGATALSSGAISVAPDRAGPPDASLAARAGPLEAARRLAATRPDHPYATAGIERLAEALDFAARELSDVIVPRLDRPRFLATPLGNAVAAALCQRSMAAGDLLAVRDLAVAGLRGHLGFEAALVAGGLARYSARGGPEVRAFAVELPRFVRGADRPHELAAALEAPGAAEALGEALRTALPGGAATVLLPPVLGLDPGARVPERISAALGAPVAETLSDVPSVPGLRLQRALDARLRAAGVEVIAGELADPRGPGAAARAGGRDVRADAWVLATGRFVGGGIARRGVLVETALGLPVQAAEGAEAGVHLAARPAASLTVRDRLSPQPLLSAGLRVDGALRPLDERGAPVHPRLFAAGAVVGGHEQATDGTGLGVAILTGYLAGRSAAGADVP